MLLGTGTNERRGLSRPLLAAGALGLLLLVAGCAEVVRATPKEVSVDTFWLGEIAPGTRHWIAWFRANEHCAAQGKKPQLIDLRGRIATYRCVAAPAKTGG